MNTNTQIALHRALLRAFAPFDDLVATVLQSPSASLIDQARQWASITPTSSPFEVRRVVVLVTVKRRSA